MELFVFGLSGCLFSFNDKICSVFFKDVTTMYIAVQLRLMVLSFVIFLSILVINKDLFVPEKSGNILLVSFYSAFKMNTGGALLAKDLLEYQCKYKYKIKVFIMSTVQNIFYLEDISLFFMPTKQV